MRYYCLNCEKIYNKDEAIILRENIGEFWGASAYEEFICCPNCKEEMNGVSCLNCIWKDTSDCYGNGLNVCESFIGE